MFLFLIGKEIQIWHQRIYSQRPALEFLVSQFSQRYPQYKFRVIFKETEELRTAYQTAALGGSGPEIIYGPSDMIGLLATVNLLLPLDEFIDTQDIENLDPSALTTHDGHLYGLGDSLGNFLMVIYNKNMLNEPAPTIDEWIRQLRALTRDVDGDGLADQWGLVFNASEPFFLVPWILGFGGRFVQNDPFEFFFNELAFSKALKLVQDFRWKYQIMPKDCDYETANMLFKNQKAAVIINGDWSWGDYRDLNFDWDIAPFPVVDDKVGQPPVLVSSRVYAVNPKVAQWDPVDKKVLQDLLKYLISQEVQLYWAQNFYLVGSDKRVWPYLSRHNPEFWDKVFKILKVNKPMPTHAGMRAVWDSLRPIFQAVMSHQLSPEKALEKAQQDVQLQLDRMFFTKKPGFMRYLIWSLIYMSGFLFLLIFWKNRKNFYKDIRQYPSGYLMVAPAFILVSALIVYPIIYNLVVSLSNLNLLTFKNWQVVGFDNFVEVFTDPNFYGILLITLFWTVINLFFHVFIGFWLALFIERVLPWRWFWRAIFIIPWAIPQFISALSWRAFLHNDFGLFNHVLRQIVPGLALNWLGDPKWALVSCIVVNVWLGFPFMMLVTTGGLKNIPPHLFEAAQIDGATQWQVIRYVIWPWVWQVLKPAAVLGFLWTFNNFNVVWLVTNGGEPADSVHILVTYAFKVGFGLYRYGYAAAFGLIIMALMLIFSYKLVSKSLS